MWLITLISIFSIFFLRIGKQKKATNGLYKYLQYSLEKSNQIDDFIHIFFSEDNDPAT